MNKIPLSIFNIDGLKKELGLSRGRVNQLLQAKRILPDIIDNSGMRYWSNGSIKRYKAALKIKTAKGKPRLFDA